MVAKAAVKLKPLGNRVIAQRSEEKEVAKGGILLPDNAREKQETAKIIAVGPGKTAKDGTKITPHVKVGDTVLMDKYAGQDVTLDDEEYIIVNADDIVAIIEG
jgi:chaperonin GroES